MKDGTRYFIPEADENEKGWHYVELVLTRVISYDWIKKDEKLSLESQRVRGKNSS